MVMEKRQRLNPSDTRRLIDDYTLYRFGHALAPVDLAKQAGVSPAVVDDLLAQKQIAPHDLTKIAHAIDVSSELLSEIAGYREMSDDMRQTLDRFFAATAKQPQQKQARAA